MQPNLILVISLDRDAKRWRNVKNELEREGLQAERLPAVDAATLSREQISAWQNKTRNGVPVGPGEVACFLSHCAAWRRAAAVPDAWTLILEDDARLTVGSGPVFKRVFRDFSAENTGFNIIRAETAFQFILLEEPSLNSGLNSDLNSCRDLGQGFALQRLLSYHGGAAGYFMNAGAAVKALALSETFCEPADHFLFHPELGYAKDFAVGQINPAPLVQDYLFPDRANRLNHASNLVPDREQAFAAARKAARQSRMQLGFGAKARLVFKKLYREFARPFRRTGTRLMRLAGVDKTKKVAFLARV